MRQTFTIANPLDCLSEICRKTLRHKNYLFRLWLQRRANREYKKEIWLYLEYITDNQSDKKATILYLDNDFMQVYFDDENGQIYIYEK